MAGEIGASPTSLKGKSHSDKQVGAVATIKGNTEKERATIERNNMEVIIRRATLQEQYMELFGGVYMVVVYGERIEE